MQELIFCLALCKKNATFSCLCIFIILTLSMTMLKSDAISPDKSLLNSVKSLNLICFFLFFIFYGFLLHTFSLLKQDSRKGICCCLIPAVLFSIFMIVGRSYYLENDWNLVFGSKLMTIKTLIQMAGYVFLFGFCLAALYEKLDHINIRTGSDSGLSRPLQFWKRQLYAHPLRTTFLTLLVFYLPYIIRNAWLPMLIRHPDIYIQATLNNLYGYFYPDGYSTMLYSYDHSAEKMDEINKILERFHTDYHYPAAFHKIRTQAEDLREKIFYLPVLSAFNLTAFYIWTLIIWIFYCIRCSYRHALQILFPLLILVLVFIAGPAYGWYFRYVYSIAFCLPAVILLGWSRYLRGNA